MSGIGRVISEVIADYWAMISAAGTVNEYHAFRAKVNKPISNLYCELGVWVIRFNVNFNNYESLCMRFPAFPSSFVVGFSYVFITAITAKVYFQNTSGSPMRVLQITDQRSQSLSEESQWGIGVIMHLWWQYPGIRVYLLDHWRRRLFLSWYWTKVK